MPHLTPLPPETSPELAETFRHFTDILGFVPNSLLTMQRRPAIVRAFGQLTSAVMDPEGSVDPGFKRLLAHFASRAAGCRYCEAHSLIAAGISGVPDAKLAAIWDYRDSDLYSEAERVALDFAMAAGSVPNVVDDLLAAVCLYGFLNRWNDSMATELEEAPKALGERILERGGWTVGKHTG